MSTTTLDGDDMSTSSSFTHRDDGPSGSLLPEQLDLWEHAALLYRAYEWQSAAEAFHSLAEDVTSQHRILCFLNAALIHARLGDFDEAASVLAEAVNENANFLMTVFIVALVSYELKDPSKAEGCFELCYEALRRGATDYRAMGMEFVLEREDVHMNLRAIREAQFRARANGNDLTGLNGIAAEFIFEAPARAVCPTDESALTGFARSKEQLVAGYANQVTGLSPDDSTPRGQWYKELHSSIESVETTTLSAMIHMPFADWFRSLVIPDPDTDPDSDPDLERSCPGKEAWWWNDPRRQDASPDVLTAPKPTYQPRELVREAKQLRVPDVVPRDPRGEYESVQDLAHFMRAQVPDGNVSSELTRPLDLDHELAAPHDPRHMPTTHQPIDSSEISQPLPVKTRGKMPVRRSTDSTPSNGDQTRDEARRTLERQRTLALLEGTIRPKSERWSSKLKGLVSKPSILAPKKVREPPPATSKKACVPTPAAPSTSTPEEEIIRTSVDTMEFFDFVLGMR